MQVAALEWSGFRVQRMPGDCVACGSVVESWHGLAQPVQALGISRAGGRVNTSTVVAVLGILATVLFGIWGVYVVIHRRYPGELTFVVEDCIGLFETIVKNFPDLAVLYQAEPVSRGLALLKGTFHNTGHKDITPEMVGKSITLHLPEDFKWLAAKIVGSSPDVHAYVEEDSTSVRFSTGLFRCEEYFRFEALAEVPVSDSDRPIEGRLLTALIPSHRIADTGTIREVFLPPERLVRRRFRTRILGARRVAPRTCRSWGETSALEPLGGTAFSDSKTRWKRC